MKQLQHLQKLDIIAFWNNLPNLPVQGYCNRYNYLQELHQIAREFENLFHQQGWKFIPNAQIYQLNQEKEFLQEYFQDD